MRSFYIALLFLFAVVTVAEADEVTTIFYRDPDSSLSNAVQVRSAFSAAARALGVNLEVRPISQRRRFVTAVQGAKGGFALMPSWFRLSRSASARPLLVARRKGQTTFQHIVLAKKGASAGAGGAIQVAGALDSDYWKQLASAAPAELKGGRFIQVPKQLDGIMALSYGQVQYCVLPSDAVQTIREQFPALLKDVTVFHETGPRPNLTLFAVGAADTAAEKKVRSFFKKLGDKKEGRKLLKLLGFDGWTPAAKRSSRAGGAR